VAAVATLAAPYKADAAAVHRLTGGNPYFVTEVLASGSADVPATVRAAVLARAAGLSPTARSTLDLVAVIPDRASLDMIATATDGDTSGVDECEQSGLLVCRDKMVAFRHELARRAVVQTLPAARAARLHAAVLAVLARQSDVDPARLAYHADLAGDAEAVLVHAPAAAREAARLGAYGAAAEHCWRALDHGERLSEDRRAELLPAHLRAELHELYGLALARGGRVDDAIDAYAQAEADWRESGDMERAGAAMAVQGQFLWAAGRAAAAREASDAAVALLRNHPPGPGLASACTYGAFLRMLERDRAGAVELGTEAIGLAEAYGQTSLLSKALNAVGCALWTTDPEAASATMARCLAVARESGDDQTIGLALGNWGSAAVEARRYAEGERLLHEDLAWCGERDMEIGLSYSRAWLARSRLEQGDWSRAEAIADELVGQPQQNVATLTIALTVLGQLRVRRGSVDAETVLSRAWRLAQDADDPPRLFPIAAARAEAAWLAGAGNHIADLVGETFALAVRLGEPWAVGELGLWLWRAGVLRDPPAAAAQPYARQMSGDWAGAALVWDAIGCPYEAAMARADSDAATDLIVAVQALHRLEARPAADLVAARLRSMGVRQVPRRRSPVANPGGLTDRELDVLRLLVDGLPNTVIADRLHISRRTADHHVAAILAKLNVRSRHEAARHARDHGWFGPATAPPR
jgi:DNA-binding CsgD family transcriptional regulator